MLDSEGGHMKRELEYFEIEGNYGGNQDWFTNVVMHIGGCAAATACDSCIYLALRMGIDGLYPYDVRNLTKADYKRFGQVMKSYIHPRIQGVKKLAWFIEGFEKYLCDVNRDRDRQIKIDMEEFIGNYSYEEARAFVKAQIDTGIPIPCLLLRHRNEKKFKDYIWHWFLLVGYEEAGDDMLIKTATYGESEIFSLREMWDTGFEEKGGFVRLSPLYE